MTGASRRASHQSTAGSEQDIPKPLRHPLLAGPCSLKTDPMRPRHDCRGRQPALKPLSARGNSDRSRAVVMRALHTGELSCTRPSMVPPKPVSIISGHNDTYKVERIRTPEGRNRPAAVDRRGTARRRSCCGCSLPTGQARARTSAPRPPDRTPLAAICPLPAPDGGAGRLTCSPSARRRRRGWRR